MTGQDGETLTAALRRLADEHASGLLSVATPGRDVVLELADGVPVGIGPPHDVRDRVGSDASPELVAAAVIDDLVDRTVAAIVGGGGEWVWDVSDDAAMMPVPPDLATELSRRAVDAAQALATLGPDQVLLQARDLETHGEVDRVRQLFDGDRTLTEVAELAESTLPATATIAAALVSAGVLTTGREATSPRSWTDAVAGSSTDDDEDEPELWVMDPPEDEEDEEDDWEDEEPTAPATTAPPVRTDHAAAAGRDAISERDTPEDIPSPAVAAAESEAVPAASAESSAAATDGPAAARTPPGEAEDDGWADTTWLDELGGSDRRTATAHGDEREDEATDPRAALSAMITDLQDPAASGPSAPSAPSAPPPQRQDRTRDVDPPAEADAVGDEDATEQRASAEAKRKEPKAAPGEVAEFLRELSRLALDDE